jgi:NADPH:quinone reductase
MKAIIYDQPGDAAVLRLLDREISEPGAGEVRIKVVVSGVNPTDRKSRSGASGGEPDPIERVPNQGRRDRRRCRPRSGQRRGR